MLRHPPKERDPLCSSPRRQQLLAPLAFGEDLPLEWLTRQPITGPCRKYLGEVLVLGQVEPSPSLVSGSPSRLLPAQTPAVFTQHHSKEHFGGRRHGVPSPAHTGAPVGHAAGHGTSSPAQ